MKRGPSTSFWRHSPRGLHFAAQRCMALPPPAFSPDASFPSLPFSIVCAPERQSVPGRSAFLFVLWRRPASFRRWPVLQPYRPRVKPPLLGVCLTSCKTVCKNLPLYSLKQRHQSWHTCWYISTYCLALALQLKSHSMARFTSCCQPSGYSYPAFARSTAFSMSWAL